MSARLSREQIEYICKHDVEDGHLFTRIGAANCILIHDQAMREEVERKDHAIDAAKSAIVKNAETITHLQADLARITKELEENKRDDDQPDNPGQRPRRSPANQRSSPPGRDFLSRDLFGVGLHLSHASSWL